MQKKITYTRNEGFGRGSAFYLTNEEGNIVDYDVFNVVFQNLLDNIL